MQGYCMLCYTLQPIRAVKGDFYPLPHKPPPKHAVCGETMVRVEIADETWYCPKCDEPSYPEDVERPKKLCDGTAHAIR